MKNYFSIFCIIASICLSSCCKDDETGNSKVNNNSSADSRTLTVPAEQWDNVAVFQGDDAYLNDCKALTSGIRLRFDMEGVQYVEIESVDGYAIAGNSTILEQAGRKMLGDITDGCSIITYRAAEGTTIPAGQDFYVTTLPCDLYGGYRLSIYKDGLVAHYFGVHQRAEAGTYIIPIDLIESDLDFVNPADPFVEDERPELDETTRTAVARYMSNPTEENKQALLDQMGIRYDKVVARKKAKLRELERDAKHDELIEEMQLIVDEMVENREIRLEQQFWRLIDPRNDDDPNDQWLVLRGSSGNNAYIAYAPVTNAEYAQYINFVYPEGQGKYPVVNVTISDALAYCEWLSNNDAQHQYRLPTEEEWILAAGHMPKDVVMNTDHIENGIKSVDAYMQTTGACGGIDFWGNCWEWTSTQKSAGFYIVKGGSWDSTRDECRSEYSDAVRDGTMGFANVGFRIVREDL